MCEIDTTLISVAAAGIVAAIVAIGVAVGLNNSFFGAPGAPAAMVAAGIASVAAVVALRLLIVDVNEYFSCMGSPDSCSVELSNVINSINALVVVLGIQATACFVAAGIAWIPWAGSAPMYAILASLITQLALVPSLYIFMADLASCANNEATQQTSATTLAIAATAAVICVGMVAYLRRKS
jgi:hypothetical protein